jgi:hypothetical protein
VASGKPEQAAGGKPEPEEPAKPKKSRSLRKPLRRKR